MKTEELLKKIKLKKEQEKIDLLLIHCDLFYDMDFSNISMGLVYIASYLEKHNYKVDILRASQIYSMSYEELRWYIRRKNPDAAGFYIISDNWELVRDMADDLKSQLPKIVIIGGGPLAAADPDKIINEKSFDMVITGEGEYALLEICNWIIKEKGEPAGISGLIYKENNAIKKGMPVKPIEDLDGLPKPDLKYFSGQQVFQVVSGRGCPYGCVFCFQAGHGLKFRFRSAENVTDEIIDALNSKPFVGFDFIDDAFIMNVPRCKKIAGILEEYRKKSGRNFVFFCQGRVNILDKHPGLIEDLSRAGLVKIQLGIESGDSEVLKAYNKQITIEQIKRVVKNINQVGSVMAVGGFILGGPFESEKSAARTIQLAEELIYEAPGVFETSAGFLGAYPGTAIERSPESFGLKLIEPDFVKGLSLSDVQMTTERLSDVNRLRKLEGEFYHRVYKAMNDNLHRIPPHLLKLHYYRVDQYKIYSLWYLFFLNKLDAVKKYFQYLKSPRFRSFAEIPVNEILQWKPMRVIEKRNYDSEGSLVLPASIGGENLLSERERILAYELSSGKLTLNNAVLRYCKERNKTGQEAQVLENVFLPLYKMLDESYRLVFYK